MDWLEKTVRRIALCFLFQFWKWKGTKKEALLGDGQLLARGHGLRANNKQKHALKFPSVTLCYRLWNSVLILLIQCSLEAYTVLTSLVCIHFIWICASTYMVAGLVQRFLVMLAGRTRAIFHKLCPNEDWLYVGILEQLIPLLPISLPPLSSP